MQEARHEDASSKKWVICVDSSQSTHDEEMFERQHKLQNSKCQQG